MALSTALILVYFVTYCVCLPQRQGEGFNEESLTSVCKAIDGKENPCNDRGYLECEVCDELEGCPPNHIVGVCNCRSGWFGHDCSIETNVDNMGIYETCQCTELIDQTCSSLNYDGYQFKYVDCTSCADFPKQKKCCSPPPPKWFFYDLKDYRGTSFFDVNDLGK